MSDKNNGKLVGEQVKFIGDIAEKLKRVAEIRLYLT